MIFSIGDTIVLLILMKDLFMAYTTHKYPMNYQLTFGISKQVANYISNGI